MGLILLDLDGTLVENTIIDGVKPMQRPQAQIFGEPQVLPGRLEVIERAANEGDRFAIVTNQGGVGWGYHTVAEVQQRIGQAVAALNFFFEAPFSVHVAWKHPRATLEQFKGDDGRKPSPKRLVEAMVAHDTSPRNTIMVGDRDEDRVAAAAAQVDFAHADDFFAV